MNLKTIQNYILDLSIGRVAKTSLDEAKISGCNLVNFTIVNSRFEPEYVLPKVHLNQWKKTYQKVVDFLKANPNKWTRYIVVSDAETDTKILYCNKVV